MNFLFPYCTLLTTDIFLFKVPIFFLIIKTLYFDNDSPHFNQFGTLSKPDDY